MKAEQDDPREQEDLERLEAQVRDYARQFRYPPTPRLSQRALGRAAARRPRRLARRLAWGGAVALVLLAALLAVPGVRAQILAFIQIGNIRIIQVPPTATPTMTASPATTGPTATALPPTSTPLPASMAGSLRNLAGEITLASAPGEVRYPVLLPDYPPGIGQPQHVYVQQLGAPVLVLVWMDPDHPEKILFSLSTIPPGSYAMEKSEPVEIQETAVNGQRAVWAEGPYVLKLQNGDADLRRLVEGAALIWVQDGNTYRLETSLPLAEAVKIAESLKPYTP